jgi:ectoine hydroxylase-related dioxygenase (phytanoyl-CoA dioxygenase family)
METDGYIIIRGALQVTDALVEAATRGLNKREHSIFNGATEALDDCQRSQALLHMHTHPALRVVRDAIKTTLLIQGYPKLSVKDFVCLRSKAGCQEQPAHCDYVPDEALLACIPAERPMGVLIALSPGGARLRVWTGSYQMHAPDARQKLQRAPPFPAELLELERGDMVMFRGDLVHAGAGYKEENLRIHAYVDSPGVKRPPDQTFLLGEDQYDWQRALLEPVVE